MLYQCLWWFSICAKGDRSRRFCLVATVFYLVIVNSANNYAGTVLCFPFPVVLCIEWTVNNSA